jgi:type IV fimbrial biogenesis protein FimT
MSNSSDLKRPVGTSSSGGFTLIELMISVLLVAVLLGIGVPSFRTLIDNQRLRAVSSDLRIALNMTRSEAVKRNRSVVLNPSDTGWGGGWSIANPVDPNDPAILNHLQAGGITITGPGSVTFSPLGRSTAAEFDIAVNASSSAELCLQMQLDGRATAIKGECP